MMMMMMMMMMMRRRMQEAAFLSERGSVKNKRRRKNDQFVICTSITTNINNDKINKQSSFIQPFVFLWRLLFYSYNK